MGSRFGGSTPKQFITIDGVELLKYTIDKFDCIEDKKIYVGLNKQYIDKFEYKNIIKFIGGDTGQDTIFKGLKTIIENNDIKSDDIIIIQDGNRPCTSNRIILNLIDFIKQNPSELVCPQIPIYGLSSINGDKQYNRNEFVYTQMPCCCNLIELYNLYSKINNLSLYNNPMEIWCEHKPIKFIKGDLLNIKITYPEDLEILNNLKLLN